MNMHRTKLALVLLGFSIVAPARAWAQGEEAPRLDEYTAYTIRARQLKLGVLAFEYGFTDRLSVGTDPPVWAASAVVSTLLPNLHVKYTFLADERLRLTAQAGIYYASLTQESGADGRVLALPLTLWGSLPLAERLSLHLEAVYNFIRGFGTGDASRTEVHGSVATEAVQLGAMLEYRWRPRWAFTLRGRVQPWMRPLVLDGSKRFDPYTNADLHVEIQPKRKHPLAVVVAGSYLWDHVHLTLGVGYGSYFVPGINIYLPYQGVIPEGSVAFLF
jgi:hypothetical protein